MASRDHAQGMRAGLRRAPESRAIDAAKTKLVALAEIHSKFSIKDPAGIASASAAIAFVSQALDADPFVIHVYSAQSALSMAPIARRALGEIIESGIRQHAAGGKFV